MKQPLFDILRDQTRDAHRRLEASPPLRRLMASDYSRAEYAALLVRLAAFFAPLERRLTGPGCIAARRCGYRPRVPAILADLQTLGTGVDVDDVAPVPRTDDAPAEIGCLYVLEGSRLGGRLIAQRIGGTLGLTPRRGLRFFAGDLAPGRAWQLFQSRAAPLCRGARETASAVDGARSTFALLHRWLCAGGD